MTKPPSRPPSAQLRPASVDGVRKQAKQPALHTFLPGGSNNERAKASEDLTQSATFINNKSKNKRAHVPGELGTFMPTNSQNQNTKTPEQPNKKSRHRYAEVPAQAMEKRLVNAEASYAWPPGQGTGHGAPRSYSYGYAQHGASYAPIGNYSPATTLTNMHQAEMLQAQRLQRFGFQPINAPQPPQLRTLKPSAVPEGMSVFVVGARCGIRGQPILAYKLPKPLINHYCPNIYYVSQMLGQDYFELPFVVTSTFDKLATWMEKKQFPHNLITYSQVADPYAVLIDIYDLAHWFGINVLKDECLNAMEWMRLMSAKIPSVTCLNRLWRIIVRDRPQGSPHQGIEQMFIDWYMALVPSPRDILGLEAEMELGLNREPAIALLLAYADAGKSGRVTEMARAGIYHQTNEAREMPFVRGHPRNGLFWSAEEVEGLRGGLEK